VASAFGAISPWERGSTGDRIPRTHPLFPNQKAAADTRGGEGDGCGHTRFHQEAEYGHGCHCQ
jgi:hypothetical protein